MQLYQVTIRELDDFDGAEPESWLGPLYASTSLVGRVRVLARGRRAAAARGYVVGLGRLRARKLAWLNAPTVCIRPELNVRTVACSLTTGQLWCGPCFVLENLVQRWFLLVKMLALPRGSVSRLQARRARRRRLAMRRPSIN